MVTMGELVFAQTLREQLVVIYMYSLGLISDIYMQLLTK